MKKIAILLLSVALFLCLGFAVSAEGEEEVIEATKGWYDAIANAQSTFTAIASALGFTGTLAVVGSLWKKIKALLDKKANAEEIKSALSDSGKELKDAVLSDAKALKEKLAELEEREKLVTAVFGIFCTYSKDLPASAKAEINKLLSGTQKVAETVEKTIETASEKIEEAEKTAPKVDTPALDAVIEMG